MTLSYDFEGTGDWPEYKALAETAMALAIAEQREVVVKWNNWVKPYNNYGEVVPVQYFKFNPGMQSQHIRGQYLNIQVKEEAVWPPTTPLVSTGQTKVYWTNEDVLRWLDSIVQQMIDDDWTPDYIVGVARGGLVPAVMLSHYFKVPLHVLSVSFRDNANHNLSKLPAVAEELFWPAALVVDDINDSGKTLSYIQSNWSTGLGLPCQNVHYAVLLNKKSSSFKDVDYCGRVLNSFRSEVLDTDWHVFPWEQYR
jgi:hypoxanthine phosphoribosyltransferase